MFIVQLVVEETQVAPPGDAVAMYLGAVLKLTWPGKNVTKFQLIVAELTPGDAETKLTAGGSGNVVMGPDGGDGGLVPRALENEIVNV